MFFKKEGYLVSDIGGTKTTIALVDAKTSQIILEKTHLNHDIKHYTDTLVHFLNLPEAQHYKVKRACIAIAGPINADRTQAKLSNYDWKIDAANILVRTSIHHVTIINDFEAIGLGVNTLKTEDYVELTNFGRNTSGAIAVIGAGTGLGVSILPHSTGDRIPMQSEGGHVDMPIDIKSTIDIKFQSFL
ncbi:MAG TPA: ROK family protein, partial [Alphaproteobacteria bacterium]|nr:ROK family protein [Alphaproteobacteria bacterium]